MALGTAASKAAIKKYVKSTLPTLHLKECDSAGSPLTTGDGTVWTVAGITKNFSFAPTVSEEAQYDDRNVLVANDVVVQDYTLSFDIMQRDMASRNFTTNAAGKYYQAALAGNAIGTLQEAHAFAVCQVTPKFSYEIGGQAHITGLEIKTLNNDASISVTLPTTIATGTITISAGAMWGTTDL